MNKSDWDELDKRIHTIATKQIEDKIAELKAAGWRHVRGHIWKAPIGGYFLGPHGAWLAMKRRSGEV